MAAVFSDSDFQLQIVLSRLQLATCSVQRTTCNVRCKVQRPVEALVQISDKLFFTLFFCLLLSFRQVEAEPVIITLTGAVTITYTFTPTVAVTVTLAITAKVTVMVIG